MPKADVNGQTRRLQPALDMKEAVRTLSSGDRGVGSCEISMMALIKSWRSSEKRYTTVKRRSVSGRRSIF